MIYTKLYKLDNNGKQRVWWIEAFDLLDDNGNPIAKYVQKYGEEGGKIQEKETIITSGKNIGKANETTPWLQCKLEAESIWRKKRDRKGYTTNRQTEKLFGPMLAQKYKDHKKKVKFPCYIQPKLDGIRCIAKVEGKSVLLFSRQNMPFTILKHIEKELRRFPNGIYDGELYIHGETLQKILSGVKRDEPNDMTEKIEYHIYDCINDLPFHNRLLKLDSIAIDNGPFDKIKFVLTTVANNENDIHTNHTLVKADGYEGIMIRNKNSKYKINGRSMDLLKYKDFTDEEFEIVDVEENKKKPGTCVFWCQTKNKGRFKVMPEGSEEQRKQYLTDWNSGKIKPGDKLTVRFIRYTTSDNPVPFHGVGVAIRNYE